MAVLRVTLNQLMFGQTIQNVVHFQRDAYTTSMAEAFATEIRDNWVAHIRGIQSSVCQYTNIKIERVTGVDVPFNLTVNLLGTQSGSDDYLSFLCHVIRLRTATPGRRGRGRLYIGGIANNLGDFGFINAGVLALWTTILGQLMAHWGPDGVSPFFLCVNPHGTTEEPKIVTSLQMNPAYCVQRRRNVLVGI